MYTCVYFTVTNSVLSDYFAEVFVTTHVVYFDATADPLYTTRVISQGDSLRAPATLGHSAPFTRNIYQQKLSERKNSHVNTGLQHY